MTGLPLAQNITPGTTIALMQHGETDGTKTIAKLKSAKNIDEIEKAAKEFEAVFLSEMLKPMFEGTEIDPPFGGGKGEEIFRGFMIQEYGKLMTERGGIGIAEHVKAEMIRIQESQVSQEDTASSEQTSTTTISIN